MFSKSCVYSFWEINTEEGERKVIVFGLLLCARNFRAVSYSLLVLSGVPDLMDEKA